MLKNFLKNGIIAILLWGNLSEAEPPGRGAQCNVEESGWILSVIPMEISVILQRMTVGDWTSKTLLMRASAESSWRRQGKRLSRSHFLRHDVSNASSLMSLRPLVVRQHLRLPCSNTTSVGARVRARPYQPFTSTIWSFFCAFFPFFCTMQIYFYVF